MKNKLNLFTIFALFLVLFVAINSVCATTSDISSDFTSDISSDFTSDISSDFTSDISSDFTSDISTNHISNIENDFNLNSNDVSNIKESNFKNSSNEPSFDLEVNDNVYGDNIYINVHNGRIGDNLLNGTCYITFNNVTYSFDVIDGEGNCTLYPNRYVYINYLNPRIFYNLEYNDSDSSLGGILEDYYLYNHVDIGNYVMNATLVSGDYNIVNTASFNITKATPMISSFMQNFYYGHNLEYYARVYGGFSELLASNSIRSPYGYIDIYAYWNVESLRVYVFDENGDIVNSSNLEPGNYSIVVEYIGDKNHYAINSTNSSFEVLKDHTNLFVNDISVDVDSTNYVTIVLKNANYCRQMGQIYWNYEPLANANVVVFFNGKIYQLTTDENGVCKLKIKLTTPGTYDLSVVYNGDDYNQPCSKSVNVTAKVSLTINQIINAAVYLKNYVSKNKKLPSTIKVGSVKCSIYQFSYLMSAAIKKINAKKKLSTKIDLIPVTAVNKKSVVKVKVYKKEYLKIVNILQSKGLKGKLPSYIYITSSKKVGFKDYTYGLANILKFYKINKRLPNYVIFTSKY